MGSPASPLDRDGGLLHQLEPEARLVAAVFRRALLDLEAPRINELERARARSFLRGAGAFGFLCALGGLDPVRVSRLVSR